MITLFRSHTACSLDELKSLMINQIKQLPAFIGNAQMRTLNIGKCSKIMRYEFKCEPINILSWLHNNHTQTKVYWSDRNGAFEMGGMGVADRLKGGDQINIDELLNTMHERLSENNPGLRYYGGISFDDTQLDSKWKDFGTYQFIVPQFEFTRSNDQTVFVYNVLIDNINNETVDDAVNFLEQMNLSKETVYRKVPQILNRKDYPEKSKWTTLFNERDQHAHEKIVLARQSIFDFDVNLRADALLKHLKNRSPDCFHFLFQFSNNSAFLGATPERLFKREEQAILSEAIAGTRPRGIDEVEDQALGKGLLNSEKDRMEHKYVVDSIINNLKPLCDLFRADETYSLRKLKGSQHLITQFEGQLKQKIFDHDILTVLHPTPAVAGVPVQDAMETIKNLEPFNRGWYTGPVGYVGTNQTEFAVAIRSGLIHDNQLSLYAGAGVVKGSTAEGEWNEIENKISNFMKVFNEEPIQVPGTCMGSNKKT